MATRRSPSPPNLQLEPLTLVKVPLPGDIEWSTALQSAREAGKCIDVILLVGGDGSCYEIHAHKVVLVSHSPYFDGLFAGFFAESSSAQQQQQGQGQGGCSCSGGPQKLKVGDEETDFHAVKVIIACFYSGVLSLSRGTVVSVIRTANFLQVVAIEKAACDFLIDSLESSSACEMLNYAAAYAECGEHALDLYERCAEYLVDHFEECSLKPSFAKLSCEAVAKVIGSDDLSVSEELVLVALRAWFDHKSSDRLGLMKVLLPLIRWPLLPVEI